MQWLELFLRQQNLIIHCLQKVFHPMFYTLPFSNLATQLISTMCLSLLLLYQIHSVQWHCSDWRHCVINHRQLDCLSNNVFALVTKTVSMVGFFSLWRELPVGSRFPSQKARHSKCVSTSWHHKKTFVLNIIIFVQRHACFPVLNHFIDQYKFISNWVLYCLYECISGIAIHSQFIHMHI